MKSYPLTIGKETWKQLEEIGKYGYSYGNIFSDFIDICLVSLLSLTDSLKDKDIIEKFKQNKLTGAYEEQYMQYVQRYKENKGRLQGSRPADYFAQAWGALVKETRETHEDILGEIYMAQISHGQHGQYFTPMNVTDMMCQIVGGTQSGSVSDPACGSGRMFISMNKVKKDQHYIGVDLSSVCAKMTALNMWLFDLNADIYEGNTLSMKMSQVWKIRKGGYLYHELVKEMPEPQKIKMQQTIFDFEEQKKAA